MVVVGKFEDRLDPVWLRNTQDNKHHRRLTWIPATELLARAEHGTWYARRRYKWIRPVVEMLRLQGSFSPSMGML